MANSLAKDKEEIERNTLQVLDRHKYIATEVSLQVFKVLNAFVNLLIFKSKVRSVLWKVD